MTGKEVVQMIKDQDIQIIDLKFVDLPGLWQHFSISAREFAEDAFTEGVGFDGSSIRGFQMINESDMLLVPDPDACFIDPFTSVATLSIICDVRDPVSGNLYSRDPRHIAKKAEAYLKSVGVAERAYFGPEAEFYILDSIRFDQSYNYGYYHLDSEEGFWNSGKEGDNGSGMHVHQSLWTDSKNLFYGKEGYAHLSDAAVHYIGGILAHAPALLAFCAPTTNSYRRLVPGYEAPINLIYSQRNRSACVRIPVYSKSERAKRLEFRCPDNSSNGYLAFAAMLMAGLDGIQNKIMPPDPVDKDLYDLEPAEKAEIKSTPGSLEEVLDALEKDYAYLMKGDVFTKDLIENWLEYKRLNEV